MKRLSSALTCITLKTAAATAAATWPYLSVIRISNNTMTNTSNVSGTSESNAESIEDIRKRETKQKEKLESVEQQECSQRKELQQNTPTKFFTETHEEDDLVTPWKVTARAPKGINYDRVLHTFKASSVDDKILDLFVETINTIRNVDSEEDNLNKKFITRKEDLHHFLRRGVVLSHRDINAALHDIATFHEIRSNTKNKHKTESEHQDESSGEVYKLHTLSTSSSESHPEDENVQEIHEFLNVHSASNENKMRNLHKESKKQRTSCISRVYLYTGRGPSATSMHLGHAIPFILTKYLQDTFALPLVIQITDDEKYLFRDIALDDCRTEEMIWDNIKDIIAFGFDLRRTFIFRNSQYMGAMYPTVLKLQKAMTLSSVKNTLGLTDSDNIGKCAFPATQAAPCFVCAFAPHVLPANFSHQEQKNLEQTSTPVAHFSQNKHNNSNNNINISPDDKNIAWRCVVPCAIDQDPFFILTRNVASRFKKYNLHPPSLLHTKFLPALKGLQHKMSSSAADQGVITLHDSDSTVHKRLRKAFSGGSGTLAQMQHDGANLEVDVAYQLIQFLCPDDNLCSEIAHQYSHGEIHSGQVKDIAAGVIIDHVLSPWRARRAAITNEDVKAFMRVRDITNELTA